MAYDPNLGGVVMFGGVSSSGTALGDTWLWKAGNWSEIATTGPAARSYGSMAWDGALNEMVLFGGEPSGSSGGTGIGMNDTWALEGSAESWTEVSAGGSGSSFPSARYAATMAYSSTSTSNTGQVVLFGGVTCDSTSGGTCSVYSVLGDTWTFGSSGWTEQTPANSPPDRDLASMAYDTALGGIVLYGGVGPVSGGGEQYLSDTWAWNGSNWLSAGAIGSPPALIDAQIASYDPLGQLVLFGGFNSSLSVQSTTWVNDASVPTLNVSLSIPTTLPANDNDFSVGDTVTFTVVAQNDGVNSITGTDISAAFQSSLLAAGTAFTIAASSGSNPVCNSNGLTCLVSGLTANISNLLIPAGFSETITFSATVAGSPRGCEAVTVPIVASAPSGLSSSAYASLNACQGGLGLEPWLSYAKTATGPLGSAQVNVANGNLAVSDVDSTPVQAHGRLGFELGRSYNSQDAMVPATPGPLGAGWQLDVGELSSSVSAGLDLAGLYVAPGALALTPQSVTFVDGAGTREVFTLRSTSEQGSVLGLKLPIDLNPPGGLSAVLKELLGIIDLPIGEPSGYVDLCLDSTYSPPPGVDMQLWRYIAIGGDGTVDGTAVPATCADPDPGDNDPTAPVAMGWTAVRPDRLRYDFSGTGQLLSVTDAAGNQLRYVYQYSATVGGLVTNPLTLGALEEVWEPTSACPATGTAPQQGSACPAMYFSLPTPLANGDHEINVTDTAGRVTSYILETVQATGMEFLVQVWEPGNPYSTAPGARPSESYTYSGTASSACGPSTDGADETAGLLCSITDANGQTTTFTYESASMGPDLVQTVMSRAANAGQVGPETLFTYNTASNSVTADVASPATFGTTNNPPSAAGNWAAPTGCVYSSGTPPDCERTQYQTVDASGRVGQIDQGNTADDFVSQVGYFWDGDQYGTTTALCQVPDENVDNNLCEKLTRAVPSTTAFNVLGWQGATTTSETGPHSTITLNDQFVQYQYNDLGEMVSDAKLTNPGVSPPVFDTTTDGYHDQYFEADGSVRATDDVPGGNGKVLSSSPEAATTYATAIKNQTPVSFWQLNDPPGSSTMTDSVGTNAGSYALSATLGVAGAMAGLTGVTAPAPPSTTALATVTSPSGFTPSGTTSWTVQLWVKTTDTAANDFLLGYFGAQVQGIYVATCEGLPCVGVVNNDTNGNYISVEGGTSVADGSWHQLTVTYTYNPANGPQASDIAIDVDGVASPTTVVKNALTGSAAPPAGTPLELGLDSASALAPTTLDNVAVFNSALSLAQVQGDYQATDLRADENTLYAVSDQTEMLTANGNSAAQASDWGDYLTTYRRDIPSPSTPESSYPAPALPGTAACTTSTPTNTGLLCQTDAPASAGDVPTASDCVAPSVGLLDVQVTPPTTASPPWSCVTATYNSLGQKATQTSANANAVPANQPAIGPTTYTYYQDTSTCPGSNLAVCDLSNTTSAGGWLEAVTDPLGNFVAYAYDAAGNVARTWERNATAGLTTGAAWSSAQSPPSFQFSETLHANPVTPAAVASGANYTLSIRSDGTVWAAGANSNGQLGNGTTTSSLVPVQASGLEDITQVSASATGANAANYVSAAVEGNGTLWTWGTGANDALGTGSTANSDVPVAVTKTATGAPLPPIIAVAVGAEDTYALDDQGNLWAWGANVDGEVGTSSTSAQATPVKVPLGGVSQIASSGLSAYAVLTNGTVYAWGDNAQGQLGLGTTTNESSPQPLVGFSNVRAVSAGYETAYAVKADGTVWAWGDNSQGELGAGSNAPNATSPTEFPSTSFPAGVGVEIIEGGDLDAAALLTNGTVWAWGSNGFGQLGQGNTTGENAPVQVPGPANAATLTVGWLDMLAANESGQTVWGWGYDADGELGNNSENSTESPVTTSQFKLDPYAYPGMFTEATRDAVGNLSVTWNDPDGNATLNRPARGESVYTTAFDTTSTYDADDNLLATITPDERDGSMTTGAGARYSTATTNLYDPFGNVVTTYGPAASDSVTGSGDSGASITDTVYDTANQATSVTTARTINPSSTQTAQAPTCSVDHSTDATAGYFTCTTSTTYDGNGLAITSTDGNSQPTTLDYDGGGQKVSQVAPQSSDAAVTELTDWVYDADGNVVVDCPPNQFDGAQEPSGTTTTAFAAGACAAGDYYATSYAYDAADHRTSMTTYQTTSSSGADVTAYGYDSDGNQTSVKDPLGNTTTTAYDADDRKTSQTVPRSATVSETTQWVYDPSGNVTAVLAPGNPNIPASVYGNVTISGTGTTCTELQPCTITENGAYSNLTLSNGAWITVSNPSNNTLALTATDSITVCATCGIIMSDAPPGSDGPAGYFGGVAGTTGGKTGGAGESPPSVPGVSAATPAGGGQDAADGGGGGGGGHNGAGTGGGTNGGAAGVGGAGGSTYGQRNFSDLAVAPGDGAGEGGAGGGAGLASGGAGGNGGGLVHLTAGETITVASGGQIDVDGAEGGGGEPTGGGGGGGAGGGIWLQAPTVTATGATTSTFEDAGGPGAPAGNGDANATGGTGANGYIDIDATTFTGPPGPNVGTLDDVTAYAYDADNRVIDKVTGAQSVQANPNLPYGNLTADPNGGYNERTQTFYDPDGNVVATLPPDAFTGGTGNGPGTLTNPDWSYATRSDFDLDDQATVNYTPRYDSKAGDVSSGTGGDGGQTLNGHPLDQQTLECPTGADPQFTLGVMPYPSGVGVCTTITSYDPAGRKATETLPTAYTGNTDRVESWTYTDDGLTATESGPNPASNGSPETLDSYIYDGDGNQTQATDAASAVNTTSYYDNDLTYQTQGQAYTPSGGSQVTHVVTYTYDGNSNVLTQTDPQSTNPTLYSSAFTAAEYTTTNTYLPNGWLAQTSAPDDDYYTPGANGDPGTFALSPDITSYAYDPDGNPTSVSSPSANAKDPDDNPYGVPTTYTYTDDNLVATETQPITGGLNSNSQPYAATALVNTYTYGPAGQKISTDTATVNTNTQGVVTSTADAGAETASYLPDGLASVQTGRGDTGTITTTYNPDGQPTSVVNAGSDGATTINLGYYLDDTLRSDASAPTSDDGCGTGCDTQNYAYNGAGQMTVETDQPGGSSGTVNTTSVADDDAGLPLDQVWSADPGNTNAFTYNADGNVVTQKANNQELAYLYYPDQTLELEAVEAGSSDSNNLADYLYTYDNDGNQVNQTVWGTDAGYGIGTSQSTGDKRQYIYDPAGDIMQSNDNYDTQTVTDITNFDHDHNRLTDDSFTTSAGSNSDKTEDIYAYNADNSPGNDNIYLAPPESNTYASYTTLTDAYASTGSGDLTNDGCDSYSYDSLDRTEGITTPAAEQAPGSTGGATSGIEGCPSPGTTASSYTYDGLDRQTSDTTHAPTSTSQYALTDYYQGTSTTIADQTSTETTPVPGSTTQYEPGDLEVASTANGSNTSTIDYLDGDGDGNITMLVDNTNSSSPLDCSARFDPFGNPQGLSATESTPNNSVCNGGNTLNSANNVWYEGQTRDPNAGTYQEGSRTYNPTDDTFTTQDSYRVSTPQTDLSVGTDPLTENTYTYVNGNPLNYNDTSGHYLQGAQPGQEAIPTTSGQPATVVNTGPGSQDAQAQDQAFVDQGSQTPTTPNAVVLDYNVQGAQQNLHQPVTRVPGLAVAATHFALEQLYLGWYAGGMDGPTNEQSRGGALGAFITGAESFTYNALLKLDPDKIPSLQPIGANYCADSAQGVSGNSGACDEGAGAAALLAAGLTLGLSTVAPDDSGVGPVPDVLLPSAPAPETADSAATSDDSGLQAAGCGGESFTAATEVRLADGTSIPLDQVRVEDKVLATDPTTGKTQAEPVTALWVNHDTDLLDLTVHTATGNTVVDTTQHHLFYDLTTHNWVQAENLHAGARLYTANGQLATVVGAVIVPGAADMWDLTVANDHDFYVDILTTAVLVHNCPMIGENGAEFPSQTMTPPNSPYRIDVENPDPGGRPGQMHLQVGDAKYMYNFESGQFEGIPNSLAKQLANDPVAARSVAKGLRYLGMQ
jgi:RHS repeat-associated protein